MNKLTCIVLAGLIIGCSERQDITLSYIPPDPPVFLTYEDDMKTLFEASCTGCHGSSGNYNMSTYAGVLGNGSDGTPNAIPGDSTSLLITKVKSMTHFAWNTSGDEAKIRLLIDWVVRDSLREN